MNKVREILKINGFKEVESGFGECYRRRNDSITLHHNYDLKWSVMVDFESKRCNISYNKYGTTEDKIIPFIKGVMKERKKKFKA